MERKPGRRDQDVLPDYDLVMTAFTRAESSRPPSARTTCTRSRSRAHQGPPWVVGLVVTVTDVYDTDRGIEDSIGRGDETVTLAWLAEELRTFVDLHPESRCRRPAAPGCPNG